MIKTTETIEDMLIRHEGMRFTPYLCTADKISLGVGRNLIDKGITKEEAMFLLHNDIEECKRDLANSIFQGQFYNFPESIQNVLINMRFQLGYTGFRNFRKMIKAFQSKNYEEAVVQMKDSNWYNQVTNRANDLIKMIREVM